jgi:hypothetical protein
MNRNLGMNSIKTHLEINGNEFSSMKSILTDSLKMRLWIFYTMMKGIFSNSKNVVGYANMEWEETMNNKKRDWIG